MATETKALEEIELPMLAGIGTALRWLEELITLVSGPLLTIGLAIALVDLLTGGRLLASQPFLLYAWAVSQALGVDGQLVGAAVKSGRAMRAGRPWQAAAYCVLILALGYVAYLASNVFATQQALGITTEQALARLGMGDTRWIVIRSLLAVILVVLSGLLRYSPAKPVVETAEERAARQRRELEEQAHKNRMKQMRVSGLRGAFVAGISGANAVEESEPITVDPADDSTGNDGGDSTGNESAPAQAGSGAKAGGMRVPAGMMTSPDFRRYLADNGVKISPEQAVAYVRGVKGNQKIGPAYAAAKGPLMRVANTLIAQQQATENERAEESA